MAVIKNQKNGMWEVRTYYKDWTGERKQKTKRGFAKKSEVLEWERNFKFALLLTKVTKPSKRNLLPCAVSGTYYG